MDPTVNDPDRPSVDTALDILSAPRRRYILVALDTTPEQFLPLSKRELAQRVAAIEDNQYSNVYPSIHQNHLEPMHNADAIRVTGPEDDVAPGPAFEPYRELLHTARYLFREVPADG